MDYQEEERRRLSDEQLRGYVGERLAELPANVLDALSPGQRERYDRLLLRCEFLNQQGFHEFVRGPKERGAAVDAADQELKASADRLPDANAASIGDILKNIETAFDKRDAAMRNA